MTENSFEGFSRDLPAFLGALRADNSKAWFDANRKRYESVYLDPAKRFVEAIAPALAVVSPDIAAEPRVNGAIMRINRDIRFSKDKTPYKTTCDLHFLEGRTMLKSNPAYVIRITPDDFWIGAGAHGFTKAQLDAWRGALVDETKGAAIRDALQAAADAGFTEVGGAHYKTVPRGFPADHPNAPLLRHNMLYVTRRETLPDALFGPGAVDYCLQSFAALRPVQAWLVDVVGDKA